MIIINVKKSRACSFGYLKIIKNTSVRKGCILFIKH